MDAYKVSAGNLYGAGARAGGQEQRCVAQALPGCQHGGVAADVDRGHGLAQAQFYAGRLVITLFVHEQLFRPGLAPQVLLGKRGSLVRALPLVADQSNFAVKAVFAECLGGLGAGQAGADDEETARVAHMASMPRGCPLAY